MTKLINLDDLVPASQRVLTLRGVQHTVVDFNVGQFATFQREFARFSKAFNSDDTDEILASAKRIFQLAVPTLTEDLIELMNPAQMMAAIALVANLIPDAPEEAKDAEAGGEGKAD